jgi:hypothetical protein
VHVQPIHHIQNVAFKGYDPPDYTDPAVLEKSKEGVADKVDPLEIRERIDARITFSTLSHRFQYASNGRPLNPQGRTGLQGRGKLYKWGPDQAAHAIVTRVQGNDLKDAQVCVCKTPNDKLFLLRMY